MKILNKLSDKEQDWFAYKATANNAAGASINVDDN
jgi:hypothetical protein